MHGAFPHSVCVHTQYIGTKTFYKESRVYFIQAPLVLQSLEDLSYPASTDLDMVKDEKIFGCHVLYLFLAPFQALTCIRHLTNIT